MSHFHHHPPVPLLVITHLHLKAPVLAAPISFILYVSLRHYPGPNFVSKCPVKTVRVSIPSCSVMYSDLCVKYCMFLWVYSLALLKFWYHSVVLTEGLINSTGRNPTKKTKSMFSFGSKTILRFHHQIPTLCLKHAWY